MRRLFRSVFLSGLLTVLLAAESLQPGRLYEGPMKLSARNFGASLMLPEGWKAQLAGPQGPLVLQRESGTSRILMEANVSVVGDPLALLPERMEYYDLRLFSPTQVKRMRPSLYYRLYQVEGSETFDQALLYLVLGTQGRAVVLYGFFTPGQYEQMRQVMMNLANTLGFTPIRALPHQLSSLYMTLSSGHFVFYQRKGSFSEKREVWLCRDGNAYLRGTYAVANNTSRSTVQRHGKWRLQGEKLVMEFDDGTAEHYRVSKHQNTLMFDKAQTFRLPNHVCE